MKPTVIVLGLAALALIIAYALWGREWLKAQPWAAPFFAWVEPLERVLFKNSETILVARAKMLIGVLLTGLSLLGEIDLTPFLAFVPDAYQTHAQALIKILPIAITLLGMMDERLRNKTTKPIEIVALPENKPLPPAVEEAVAQAEAAKVVAVETIKDKAL